MLEEGRGRVARALRALLRLLRRWTRIRRRPLGDRAPRVRPKAEQSDDREAALGWWAELTGRHPGEVGYLLELSDRLSSPDLRPAIGLGYSLHPFPRPLVLLDAAALGVPPAHLPLEPAELGVERMLFSGPLSDVPDALVLPTLRPEPLSGTTGGQLVGPATARKVGTMGLRVRRPLDGGGWRNGYLTAGHTFPDGAGTPVIRLPANGLRRAVVELTGRRTEPIGVVALHESPVLPGDENDPPAFDYAIVDVEDDGWDTSRFTGRLPDPPSCFTTPALVTAHGGISGEVRHITLMGALMAVAQRWRHCWLLGPTCALRDGDSGTPVVDPSSGEQLGMFVGRAMVDEQAQHLYVQSLSRLAAGRLSRHGIEIEYYV